MICYKDRAFCASDCIHTTCIRLLSEDVKRDAAKWWEGCDGEAPIAVAEFHHTCLDYVSGSASE